MAPPAQHTGPVLPEAASSRAAIPQHREVREAHPGREVLEDELEVAGRPQREDTRSDELRSPRRLVHMPTLQLLADPRDDARHLLRED
eukprot:11340805-Alexandrium_andersonii.AAC.1